MLPQSRINLRNVETKIEKSVHCIRNCEILRVVGCTLFD